MRRSVTLIEEEEIINLYKKGFMVKDIHNKINRHRMTITKILKKHNIKIRAGSKKYKCNDNYFETIDCEKKAYILGFISADGGVYKHYKAFFIILKKSDNEHLNKILKSLNANNPIYYINNTCKIQISSEKMIDDLKKYGVVPNKTHIIKPYINLNEELLKHYWRGFIDGDGCITKNGKQWEIHLAGNKNIVEGFSKYIKQRFKTKAIPTLRKDSSVWKFKCGGNILAKQVITHFYKDANIYLDRKMELAQQVINTKDYIRPSKFSYITREDLIKKYKELGMWKKVDISFGMSLATGQSLRTKFNLINYSI